MSGLFKISIWRVDCFVLFNCVRKILGLAVEWKQGDRTASATFFPCKSPSIFSFFSFFFLLFFFESSSRRINQTAYAYWTNPSARNSLDSIFMGKVLRPLQWMDSGFWNRWLAPLVDSETKLPRFDWCSVFVTKIIFVQSGVIAISIKSVVTFWRWITIIFLLIRYLFTLFRFGTDFQLGLSSIVYH